jgi:hypothetical protein
VSGYAPCRLWATTRRRAPPVEDGTATASKRASGARAPPQELQGDTHCVYAAVSVRHPTGKLWQPTLGTVAVLCRIACGTAQPNRRSYLCTHTLYVSARGISQGGACGYSHPSLPVQPHTRHAYERDLTCNTYRRGRGCGRSGAKLARGTSTESSEAEKDATIARCVRTPAHPFDTGCLPLSYSGNPGVNPRGISHGVYHRGGRCVRTPAYTPLLLLLCASVRVA